jgi:hypothetical protein
MEKECTNKIETETRRLTNLLSQVQKVTEAELLGAREQLQAVSSEFEARTEQAGSATQRLVEGLADQVENVRSEVNGQIERQKENINQVNAKLVALESKVLELPRQAVGNEPCPADLTIASSSMFQPSDMNQLSVLPDENRTCSCQTSSCKVCNGNPVNACRVQVSENQQVSSYLSPTELPPPIFDEGSDTNQVYHLRQLDEFMKFRGIPKALQLAVAYRSIKGQMGRQWVETACYNLKDYDEFKRAFLNSFWSSLRQGVEKCTLPGEV